MMTYADRLSMMRCYIESAYDLADDVPHATDVRQHLADLVEELGFLEAVLRAEATT